ncbi:hypothetical protein Pmar_PMAR015829 [Perkinsus marinus ATCC 50983]|uniref:Uncharacterized protein n=1 Tax=Perkinsus marinus (strain ATCC 50983 / TXsc) TaxID=423536 RepID=C5K881_PERM5|nr:hypothetical protein Pmar_PMAR015829 [Perkinsus marinus ATCC 50983]EER19269.1 hypothetical protein Pmar_PMAR015829 [Perkinsus marinus ATCC 50983]|eukprot:XP_002787473.1 hypothetical protein Pmar_PMAR015829 [Perkinsus marinus ATCC 50983]
MGEALGVAWEAAPGMTRAIVLVYVALLMFGLFLETTQAHAQFEFVELSVRILWRPHRVWVLVTCPFLYTQHAFTTIVGLPVGYYLLSRLPSIERAKGSTGLLLWFLITVYTTILLPFLLVIPFVGLDRLIRFSVGLRLENRTFSGLFALAIFMITKECIINREPMQLGSYSIPNKWYPCVLILVVSVLTWRVRLDLVAAALLALLDSSPRFAFVDKLQPSTRTLAKVETNLLRNWFMPMSLFGGEYIPIERSTSFTANDEETEMSNAAEDIESALESGHQGDTAVAGNTSDVAGGFSTNGDEHHLPLPVVAVTSVPENISTSSDKHIGVDRSMDQDSMRAPLVSSREA